MLLFSTVLPINDAMTKDGFIRLVIEWNQNTPYPENIIPGIEWNENRNVRYGNDNLWLEIQEYRNKNTIAVRFEKVESDGAIWDSDYVMNFDKMEMAIQLDRSFRADAQSIASQFSTPYFITLLIEKGYLKDDGRLPILRRPILITEENLDLLTGVINGIDHYNYPVVYVSKNKDGTAPVDTDRLASRLKGIAHVLLQDNPQSNQKIRIACRDKNEYYGTIGIYFPSETIEKKKYCSRSMEGNDRYLSDRVVQSVMEYFNRQNVEPLFTWMGVNNALLRDRLISRGSELVEAEKAKRNAEIAREKAVQEKTESDSLVAMTDDEIAGFKHQIESLTHMNERLIAENAGLRAKVSTIEAKPIILAGNEDDLFPGEVKDIVLSILASELDRIVGENKKSRRIDIIRDILESNKYERKLSTIAEELKVKLKGYANMNSVLRRYFEEIGFTITEEGKHYRLTYYGDARYHTTIAKTGSDNREGKNIASQIIRDML